jgi:transcriptional regulator with XRE-family HTH domain
MPTARRNAADLEVGRRLHLLRLERKVSQTKLADHLGVSFQQIQKYENGANRIAAGRLKEIAEYLDVPIAYFFEAPKATTDEGKKVFEFIETANALRLLKAFSNIKHPAQRNALLQLAEEMATGMTNRRPSSRRQ